MDNAFDKQELNYDKRRRHMVFKVENAVMCKKQVTSSAGKGNTHAFGGKNQGPFTIVRVLGQSVYEIAKIVM